MLTALTRSVGPSIGECALSFLPRQAIDVALAMQQHAAYEGFLRGQGARVISLPAEPDLPDAVFVEDTAVVVDEVAVMTQPKLDSRRREVPSVATALTPHRRLAFVTGIATLEGGDVVWIGRTLYVGASERTNAAGIAQLGASLEPYNYQVRMVEVTGCLHLKSTVSYVGRNTLLANCAWADLAPFDGFEVVDVPASEPGGANALLIGEEILLPASYPHAQALLEA